MAGKAGESGGRPSRAHRAQPAAPLSSPLSRRVVVANPEGLHMRPITAVVGAARKFKARVSLIFGERKVDAREVSQLMSLAAEHGAELIVEADGPDAAMALETLSGILAAPAPPG